MHLTLFIPELIWPQGDDGVSADLALPALTTLLARGGRNRRAALTPEAALCELFGQAGTTSFAALRRAGENGVADDPDAARICCDPVHLRFHQDRLILADSANFGITQDEAQAFVATLNEELADAGVFEVASAERWYLRLADAKAAAQLATPPLSAVAGRSVERLLEQGSAGKRLRALLNEAQMLLHAHPINEEREREGRLPVNGLWFWGGGSAPARVDSDIDGLWSGAALARGLAHYAGVPAHAEPERADALLEHVAPDANHLVVLEELIAPVHYEDAGAYRAALVALEQRWFVPLQAALAAGRVKSLSIHAPTAYGVLDWRIGRSDRWKLWRRPQPLAALAKELARE